MNTELAYSRLDKFGILQCVIGYFLGKYLDWNARMWPGSHADSAMRRRDGRHFLWGSNREL